jgi:hypothetical protein
MVEALSPYLTLPHSRGRVPTKFNGRVNAKTMAMARASPVAWPEPIFDGMEQLSPVGDWSLRFCNTAKTVLQSPRIKTGTE